MGTTRQSIPPALKGCQSTFEPRAAGGLPSGSPSVHLDALRGLAAFSVLLNHWRDAFFLDYSQLAHHDPLTAMAYFATGLGHQWVIVFFVMSGYLVGGSVLRSVEQNRWSWRSYLLARVTRLYVVLLPALLLGGMIDWAGMHTPGTEAVYSGHSGVHSLTVNVHSTLTLRTAVANGLFLQTIEAPALGSNGPLWSLSNEFWYYMAFPLLVLLFTGSRSWRMRAACGAGLLVWGWFVGPSIALLAIPWLMGVSLTMLPRFPARRSWMRGLAIVVAFVLFGGGLVVAKLSEGSPAADLMLGVAVTFLLWVILHCTTAPLPLTYVRVAQRAAHSSYTLYLVHMPLVIFLKATMHLDRAAPGWHMLLLRVAILLGAVAYGQLIYELFEKNTERVRKWIKPYVLGRQTA